MKLPRPAAQIGDLLRRTDLNTRLPAILGAGIGPTSDGKYLHWDDLTHRDPPAGLTREEWWLGIKFARISLARPFPLRSVDGMPFTCSLTDAALAFLHWIDQHGAGEILVSEGLAETPDRSRYVVSSQIEEAITSSQLEGATATRKVAKEMIRSGRQPRDHSERMIFNNYQAMTRIRDFAAQPLTPGLINELHEILTRGTLEDPAAAGRPQRVGDTRVRVFDPEGQVVHVPPSADELDARLEAMCEFANDKCDSPFIHPVVRAILLHLWLAYDHPYEDGNGRTARALFYWSMLSNGYWIFEYLSISKIIYGAPSQYARAFLLTETDNYDATYFLLHQLGVVRKAVDELMTHLRKKMSEVRQTLTLLRASELNHRQVALLTHALRNSDAEYTAKSHAASHRVTEQSARTDLLDLEDRGMLRRRKVGKRFVFNPVPDLEARLSAA